MSHQYELLFMSHTLNGNKSDSRAEHTSVSVPSEFDLKIILLSNKSETNISIKINGSIDCRNIYIL